MLTLSVFGVTPSALTAAACLADVGYQVHFFCPNATLLKKIKQQQLNNLEPTLVDLFNKQMRDKRLHLSDDIKGALSQSDWLFFYFDSGQFKKVAQLFKQLLPLAKTNKVFVQASTFVLGSAEKLRKITENSGKHTFLLMPDFMTAGKMVSGFCQPDRLIIGGNVKKAQALFDLLTPLHQDRTEMMLMNLAAAELVKIATNAMLATRVSFINEVAQIASQTGADIETVRLGLGADKRIGYDYLYAGTGFGGYSLDEDVQGLLKTASEFGCQTPLLNAIIKSNRWQKEVLFRQLWQYFKMNLKGKKIAIWGVSYKPGSADILGAPSLVVITLLLAQKASVVVYDPLANKRIKKHFNHGQLTVVSHANDALIDADALMIFTEHKAFGRPDFDKMKQLMKNAVIFDGRNLYEPERLKLAKIDYFSVGRS